MLPSRLQHLYPRLILSNCCPFNVGTGITHLYHCCCFFSLPFSPLLRAMCFEIVLTLECAVDHSNMEIEDEEMSPEDSYSQQELPCPSQSHSPLQSYDSSFFQQQQQPSAAHQQQHHSFSTNNNKSASAAAATTIGHTPPTSSSLASPSSNSTTHRQPENLRKFHLT